MKTAILFLFLSVIGCSYLYTQTTSDRRDADRYGYRPELVRGPYLQVATSSSIIARWRTNELDVSFLRFGTALGKLDHLAGNSYRTREHIVTLTGLQPQTKYYYLIEGFKDTLQGDENNYFFTTLPVIGD